MDDFKVQDDDTFGYDSYPDGEISLSSIPIQFKGEVWFPDHDAHHESGARRGTAYIFTKELIETFETNYEWLGIRKFKVFT